MCDLTAAPTPEAPARVFDGAVLTVRIPMTFKRRGGRKLILAPDGAADLAAEPPRPDGTALRALGRAWRWHRLLEAGAYPSIKALARPEGVHHAYAAKLLRLTLWHPTSSTRCWTGGCPRACGWRSWCGRCRVRGPSSRNVFAA